jgi:diacylglycerol kinase (ATP)
MVPSFQDGLLEVCAIRGAHHMGAITVGLSKSLKIGQGKSLMVHLKYKTPIQVDGEPWLEEPSTIKVSFLNHASMMYNIS